MSPTESASTPLMRQYHALKQQVPNALLMFRLGDFYELFFEDAVAFAVSDDRYTAGVANLRAQVAAEVLPRS